MKIAINGFGRIGRQFFQAAIEKNLLKNIVAINDIASPESLAYLLKYDSVHGKRKEKIGFTKDEIIVNNQKILFFNEKDPEKLPWKKLKIDLVIESSGIFTKASEASRHLKAGAKKVLITAPGKGDIDSTIILGVNDKALKKADKIISMASCTSNCVIPMVKVLNDKFGIEKAYMVTTHAMTGDQKLVDFPHKDFRRGRSASVNIIPTTTGAAKMAGEIIPELNGKIDGYALRVPVIDGSIVNLTAILKKQATEKEINSAFKQSSETNMKSILEYCEDPLVSTDIIHNPASCIFDSLFTKCIGNMVNIIGWYDNEWGYSCRLVELCKLIEKLK